MRFSLLTLFAAFYRVFKRHNSSFPKYIVSVHPSFMWLETLRVEKSTKKILSGSTSVFRSMATIFFVKQFHVPELKRGRTKDIHLERSTVAIMV